MAHYIRIFTLFLCLMGILLGCRGNLFHSDYAQLPGAQWDGRQPMLFDLPVVDESWEGYLWVSVRTAGSFAYEQVVVHAEVRCAGHCVEDHLLTIAMHDSNSMNALVTPCKENVSEWIPLRLEAGKHYTLCLRHSMRVNPLDHIAFVGFGLQGDEKEPKQ